MPCNRCGAPTKIEESDGATTNGEFREKYECANGHVGTIKGRAEEPAVEWRRTGPVFQA